MWLFAGCNSKTKSNGPETADAAGLESIKLIDLSGQEIDMSEFRNKTVFLNFWATWCKPCLQEMPTIERAQKELKDKNVIFLLASDESLEQIKGFKERRAFQFRYVQVQNLAELNIQALPTTFIFDPEGKLVFSEAGFRAWDTSESIDLITKISAP
jgi:thiol-disulfide isomerase/thioredoxin